MSKRSSPYPSSTIPDSIEFATRIYKNYGSSYRATREEISTALNYSAGSLNLKISTAVQYGLLDLKSKEGYKVTNLFVRFYRPISPEDSNEALIEMFKNPPLYSEMVNSFEGNILPPLKPLANILLQRHNISESACDKAAEIFEENANFINALNNERVFEANRFLTKKHENEEVAEVEEEIPNEVIIVDSGEKTKQEYSSKPSQQSFSGSLNPIPHNIPLKGKRPAQLLLPSDVGSNDFDFIVAYINLIRQQYN